MGPRVRTFLAAAALLPALAFAPRGPLQGGSRLGPTMAQVMEARLEALDPARPAEYFLLAEEVEDRAAGDADRALARQLYGLAGALDASGHGRSAAIALAGLAPDAAARARLLRLAAAIDSAFRAEGAATESAVARPLPPGAGKLAQAMAAYRRGESGRARELLALPEVNTLLEQCGGEFEGGAEGFRNSVAAMRGRPLEEPSRLAGLMFLEESLLAGDERWSRDLLLGRGAPLAAFDPRVPGPEFGVDPARARWRDGAWAP
ncbi:MAG: hypothetical protein U0574_03940 [Phycisphaerales bacterium]